MIHQWLVFELSLKALRIANTIPWFDADERSFLAVGAPESNYRCSKFDSYLSLTSLIEQFCTMELTFVDLDGVVAPCVI